MINLFQKDIKQLMHCFPGSFINYNFEIILNRRFNIYFRLEDVENPEDLKCKVIAYVSRHAFKTMFTHSRKRDKEIQDSFRQSMNDYLGTNFSREDMEEIYTRLGNDINRKLCREFIENNYNLSILSK